MMAKAQVTKVLDLVVKDVGLERPGIAFSRLEELRQWLESQIEMMMAQDFQRLIHLLYRIDISEEKAKMAFASAEPSVELAQLIVERELQKVISREKYREGNEE